MPQIELTPAERRVHRAEAHHLDPVVIIGGDGLTPAVQKEVDAALNAHGLIKVRVFGDDRAVREQIYQQLCDELNAAPIQHIGKLLVLWRPIPEKEKAFDEDRMPGPRDIKVLKFGRAGQKPEVKQLRVLGNQRLTAGGTIKRAKPKQKSVKKAVRTDRKIRHTSPICPLSLLRPLIHGSDHTAATPYSLHEMGHQIRP